MLREEFGQDVTLQRGSGGIFEVAVDGAVVARKTWTGFPSEDDIRLGVARVLEAGGDRAV